MPRPLPSLASRSVRNDDVDDVPAPPLAKAPPRAAVAPLSAVRPQRLPPVTASVRSTLAEPAESTTTTPAASAVASSRPIRSPIRPSAARSPTVVPRPVAGVPKSPISPIRPTGPAVVTSPVPRSPIRPQAPGSSMIAPPVPKQSASKDGPINMEAPTLPKSRVAANLPPVEPRLPTRARKAPSPAPGTLPKLADSTLKNTKIADIKEMLVNAGINIQGANLKSDLIALYKQSVGTVVSPSSAAPAPILETQPSSETGVRPHVPLNTRKSIVIPTGSVRVAPIPIRLPSEVVSGSVDNLTASDVISSGVRSAAEGVDREMLELPKRGRLTAGKATKDFYTLEQMRNIARSLGLNPQGNKPVLYHAIISKLDELGAP